MSAFWFFLKWVFLLLCLPGIALAATAKGEGYSVGVYYFPGWKDFQAGASFPLPWERIKIFSDRKPVLGWYDEGQVNIAEQHIDMMANHGIDFVIYDWYWGKGNTPQLDHALNAYLKAENRNRLKFTILWANHSSVPSSKSQFESMVDYWISNYFSSKQFLQIDGKPVVYIFSMDRLRDNAKTFGEKSDGLLALAREKARAAGYAGIYFVGGTEASNYWVKDHVPEAGYDALTAYNYHFSASPDPVQNRVASHSFIELDQMYASQWSWLIKNSPVPYFVPVSSGWDMRPWGGSRDTLHDNSSSTPETFLEHLRKARGVIDANPEKTRRTVIICCWNEFGEGSYIEPTKKMGFRYLDVVKQVFGK